LTLFARRNDFRLLAALHPHAADIGIEIDVDFVLEHRRLVFGQIPQKLADLPQFPSALLIDDRQYRTRPAPDHLLSM